MTEDLTGDDGQLPPGLRSRYSAIRLLGVGTYGRVVLCDDRQLERQVALKLLSQNVHDEDSRARFRREARVTANLHHPRVVEVFDFGVSEEGTPFIAYAALPGPDLAAAAQRAGRAPDQILRWARQLAEALEVVHAADLLHRDVKPENSLLDAEGGAVLADFGLARDLGDRDHTFLTQEGLVLGTPAFMAPELYRGEPASPGTDQFAWGATVFHLLTGISPYRYADLSRIVASLREDAWFPYVTRSLRGVPEVLAGAVTQALDPNPSKRAPDMKSLRVALRRPGSRTATSRQKRVAPPPPPAASRARVRLAGTLVTGCLLVALLIPASDRPPRAPPPPASTSSVTSADPTAVTPSPDLGPRLQEAVTTLQRAIMDAGARVRRADTRPPRRTSHDWLRIPASDVETVEAAASAEVHRAIVTLLPLLREGLLTPAVGPAAQISLEITIDLTRAFDYLEPPQPEGRRGVGVALADDRGDTLDFLDTVWSDWKNLCLQIEDELLRPALRPGSTPGAALPALARLAAVTYSPSLSSFAAELRKEVEAGTLRDGSVGAIVEIAEALRRRRSRELLGCDGLPATGVELALAASRLVSGEPAPGTFRHARIYVLNGILEMLADCPYEEQTTALAEALGRLAASMEKDDGPVEHRSDLGRLESCRHNLEGGVLDGPPQLEALKPALLRLLDGLR